MFLPGVFLSAVMLTDPCAGATECIHCSGLSFAFWLGAAPTPVPESATPGTIFTLFTWVETCSSGCIVNDGNVWVQPPGSHPILLASGFDSRHAEPSPPDPLIGPISFELDPYDLDEAERWDFRFLYEGGWVCNPERSDSPAVSAIVSIAADIPCRPDTNFDNRLDFLDLLNYISHWGEDVWFDLDDDGTIGFTDLVLFLDHEGCQ